MKIAIDGRPLKDGSEYRGIGVYLRNLLTQLPHKERYVLITDLRNPVTEDYGIQIEAIPFSRWDFVSEKRLSKCLKRLNVTLFHFTAQYNVISGISCPFSITVHDLFNEQLYVNDFFYALNKYFLVKRIEKAHRVIAISEYVRQSILESTSKLTDVDIDIVYNGRDAAFASFADDFPSILSDFKITKPYIIMVANFEKRKNLLPVMRAFNAINADRQYQLVVCSGTSPLFIPRSLKDHCQDIIFVQKGLNSKEISALYKRALFLCFPSMAEGFGIPIIEAMSVGTPVLTSNCTSMPEVGGDAAYFVDPFDPSRIQEGMQALLTDKTLYQRLKSCCEANVQRFSYEKCAQETAAFLKKTAT